MKTVAFCTILSIVLLLASCADAPTESETEAVASTVAADQSAPPPAALTPDGSAPATATAGVASSSSASSAPVLAAGAACPKPVSGTACATPYGTAYPGGDRTQPRCVVCYDTDSVGPGRPSWTAGPTGRTAGVARPDSIRHCSRGIPSSAWSPSARHRE